MSDAARAANFQTAATVFTPEMREASRNLSIWRISKLLGKFPHEVREMMHAEDYYDAVAFEQFEINEQNRQAEKSRLAGNKPEPRSMAT